MSITGILFWQHLIKVVSKTQKSVLNLSIYLSIYQLQNRKGRCRAAPLAEVTGWALIELKMTFRVAS